MNKTITVNWNDIASIKKAEKLKTKYENEGYLLIRESSTLFTSTLTYKSPSIPQAASNMDLLCDHNMGFRK